MKNDWITIYGDEVVKTGSFTWLEDLAENREAAPTAAEAAPEAEEELPNAA